MNLPHGYTNRTRRDGDAVLKYFVGLKAQGRLQNESQALQRLQGLLPIPVLLEIDERAVTLRTTYAAGRHGRELSDEGNAAEVLRLCGALLRQASEPYR